MEKLHLCVCVHVSVCACACMCVYMFVCMHVCIFVCVNVYVCVYMSWLMLGKEVMEAGHSDSCHCNPSYSGGEDQEACGCNPALGKCLLESILILKSWA
jgi:hypothetical protein